MQANWNTALGPEALGDNRLRSTSFEQETSNSGNPLRSAMEGYCPVQLQEGRRWVAGNPDLQTSYEGQVFHFSSEAARQRFEAAPQKYAPVHGGNDIVFRRGTEPHRARQRESLRRVARAAVLVLQFGDAGYLPGGSRSICQRIDPG